LYIKKGREKAESPMGFRFLIGRVIRPDLLGRLAGRIFFIFLGGV